MLNADRSRKENIMKQILVLLAGMAVMGTAAVLHAESVSDKRGLTLEGAKKVFAATVAEA